MSVAKIFRRNVITVAPDRSLREAAEVMRAQHVGSLVVAEGEIGACRPLGVITDRDIVVEAIAAGVNPEAVTVGEVAAAAGAVVTVALGDDLFSAATAMRTHRVRRLPVVDDRGRLVGILSFDDLLDGLVEMLGDLARVPRAEQDLEQEARS